MTHTNLPSSSGRVDSLSQIPLSPISEVSSNSLYIDFIQIPSNSASGDLNYNDVLQSTPISPEHTPLELDQTFIQRSRKRQAVLLEHGHPSNTSVPSALSLPSALSAPSLPSASSAPSASSPVKRRGNAVPIGNRNAIFVENGLPSVVCGSSPTRRRRNAVIFENGYIPTHHQHFIQPTQSSQPKDSDFSASQIAQALLNFRDQELVLADESSEWDLSAFHSDEDVDLI
ncbi:uncharacterized protein MELLADRAFT_66924 [Melampsora larici-populina 98AG31]|uniref:Uncharacterized protein n=1 Tax=Melampsora larici-populina (strain 98AG31 / pathotype 3-4-7) TaxID=747676 RepID=F4S147_MELLP|nr:uncharacterized protein MELLADRAFT_66924 [Melampsora larici-populina 98AG31]EGG01632.1 hypothetical protein MELLADRAFT_66924 [Melampsora larici-populina 98AG31]